MNTYIILHTYLDIYYLHKYLEYLPIFLMEEKSYYSRYKRYVKYRTADLNPNSSGKYIVPGIYILLIY